jgi:electron transfer flavoprotein alpha subunit
MSGILVITEQSGGAWHRMSFETLAAGQKLARETGAPLFAAVAGSGISALGVELAKLKLDRVHVLDSPLLAAYTADSYVAALEALIRAHSPAHVLFPHTYQVRDFAPRLATRFGTALVSDVTGYEPDGAGVLLQRQLFQGKWNAAVRPAAGAPVFASIQAGAFRADTLETGQAAVVNEHVALDAAAIRVKSEAPFRESDRAVDLTSAEIIVAVGRGIREKENLAIVEALAAEMGAELAASRPICDNGWLPMERQVGSSGQTVAPKLYIAVGISGAIQHLVGMKGAKTIVAINRDAGAPIFEVADYGIAGDLFEIVPALTEAVKSARS